MSFYSRRKIEPKSFIPTYNLQTHETERFVKQDIIIEPEPIILPIVEPEPELEQEPEPESASELEPEQEPTEEKLPYKEF